MSKIPKSKGSDLWEYSVIYTDRAINLMSPFFQQCMKDISSSLKKAYNCESIALIPGSGTYGMEAIARQFGTDKKCMVLRNGYFSFRWSDIMEVTKILSEKEIVVMAKPTVETITSKKPQFSPLPIDQVCSLISKEKPETLFLPHVETSTGIILPDWYIQKIADEIHKYNGVLVVDAIASGTIWIDMKKLGVDVCLSAPQKGWSGPACCALVMLNKRAAEICKDPKQQPESNSFCCNLQQWLVVMEQYENNNGDGSGFKYYTTLPTDALIKVRDAITETKKFGFDNSKQKCLELGKKVRQLLENNGFISLAAKGFQAPGVVVSYKNDKNLEKNMVKLFKQVGIQIAGGVPLKLNEEKMYNLDTKSHSFRIGLFGLDKIKNIEETIKKLEEGILKINNKEDNKL